jgi:hypothetical protein
MGRLPELNEEYFSWASHIGSGGIGLASYRSSFLVQFGEKDQKRFLFWIYYMDLSQVHESLEWVSFFFFKSFFI